MPDDGGTGATARAVGACGWRRLLRLPVGLLLGLPWAASCWPGLGSPAGHGARTGICGGA